MMDRVRVTRSALSLNRVCIFSRSLCKDQVFTDNNPQFPREKGHNLDNMSYQRAFNNNSSSGIVETAFLVEPPGWYPGRQYYVVWKGYTEGIFHKM